jgi:DNA-binding CsgD family transcriptional regulator
MTRQYVALGKSPAKIAEEAGCTQMTVYRKLREFNLLK